MKELFLMLTATLGSFAAMAQIQPSALVCKTHETTLDRISGKPVSSSLKSQELWSSTFNNAGEWTVGHDASACSLDWTIGTTACSGNFPIPNILSTTAADGWAMVDSDLYGLLAGGIEVEDSWINMTNPVDVSGFPNVIVDFETHYRRYNYEQAYLVVGFGDGSGLSSVVWPDLNPSSDLSGMTNVFPLFKDFTDNEVSNNAEEVRVNISAALAGASALELQNVYIRLHWTGTWGYAWFVDDFRIYEQPADDILLLETWFTGINNSGTQFGSIPESQLDTTWYVGAEVANIGFNDQSNVQFDADYTSFTTNGSTPVLQSDSSVVFESMYSGTVNAGTYLGVYSVVSNQESGGLEFANNIRNRSFEITSGSQVLYAQDAIGLHDPTDEKLGYLGTNSFVLNAPSTADGLVLAVEYPIHNQEKVSGIRVMLESGSAIGGEVYGSIKNTATFLAGNMTSLVSSPVHYISATDLSNGYIDVQFNNELTLNPGAYYACATLYSGGNVNDVRVLDDRTLQQPELASAMYVPGGAVFSNGTALGIRLMMGSDWGVGLQEEVLAALSVYPNPTRESLKIINPEKAELNLDLYDLFGRKILSFNGSQNIELNLSALSAGAYILNIQSGDFVRSERIIKE